MVSKTTDVGLIPTTPAIKLKYKLIINFMNKLSKFINDEKNKINWQISKWDLNWITKCDLFPYKSATVTHKYINGNIFNKNHLYCVKAPGGYGKTNLLISFSQLYNLTLLLGKNINKNFLEILNNNKCDIVIIDAINEINIDLKYFFCNLSKLKKTILISYRNDLEITNKIDENINAFFKNRYSLYDIESDKEIKFDYERLDLSNFKNVEIVSLLLISKLLQNKRNIHFLYSLLKNNELKTNNKNAVGIIRDLIEQYFKKKSQHQLWNKLKKSTFKNNLFKKLSETEINNLLKCDFNFKDGKFEIEEIFNKFIDTEVWNQNSSLELSEYASAYKNLKNKREIIFNDFRQYLLFCCCNFLEIDNPPKITLDFKKDKSHWQNMDEFYCFIPFLKVKDLPSFFLNNINHFIVFFISIIRLDANILKWTNFENKNIQFNDNNFIFLVALFLLKNDEIAIEIANRFVNYFDKCKLDYQKKIIEVFVKIFNFLFKNINEKWDSDYYYIFSRFALLLRKINFRYKFKKILLNMFNEPPNLFKYTHSWEGIFIKNFDLDIKRNTYFWNIRNKNCERLQFEHKFKFSEHFNSYFDNDVSHNRPLIESSPMQTPRKGKWKIVDNPVISKTFSYWLNTEPLFKNLNINDGKYTELTIGYRVTNTKSYWTFENDDEAYIIDVLWYYLSAPRKKSNPDSCHLHQRGIYDEQYHFINNPFDWFDTQLNISNFSNKFNNKNLILYKNAPLFERVKYTLSKIDSVVASEDIIFIDETIKNSFNFFITLSFSNVSEISENKFIYFKSSSNKYTYQEQDYDICYNDKTAEYQFDNLHNLIVRTKNKSKYKNFMWIFSFCIEYKWIEIINFNNNVEIRVTQKQHTQTLAKGIKYDKSLLFKKLENIDNKNPS